MNSERLRSFYLETQINNSSPGQRLVMLYDGLIQNAESADSLIGSQATPADHAQAGTHTSRCINILTELSTSLDFQADPKLCGTLHDLYSFFTRELAEGFEKRDPLKIRAILPLIRNLRDAWAAAERHPSRFQVEVAA